MNVLKQYDEYVKAYNMLADKLEVLGANDDIFEELSSVCLMALNFDMDKFCEVMRNKKKASA